MRKYLFILIFSFVVLPMASQTKKVVTQSKKTTVTQPKKISFQFEIQRVGQEVSFKKDGENNFYVVNFGKKTAHQLYMDALSHIASIYRNPEYVTSKVEDRSIVINGYADEIGYYKDWGYTTLVSLKYRIEFKFKDGKIRVNAPTIQEVYLSSALKDEKFSDYPDITVKYATSFGTNKDLCNAANTYMNSIITAVVYGSEDNKDNDW